MKRFIIYKVTNKINGKIYIGQTSKTLKQRMRAHFNVSNNNPRTYFHKAINHYGKENFAFKELVICDSQEEAHKLEIEYIDHFNSKIDGYNLTNGGEGTLGWSPCDDWRKNQSRMRSGKNNPMYGKNFMDYMSDNDILNYKNNMSKITSGKGNGMYGRLGSKCKTSKKYIVTTPEGEDIEVHGLRDFCRNYKKVKLNHNYLSYCAIGKIPKYKGFSCRYF